MRALTIRFSCRRPLLALALAAFALHAGTAQGQVQPPGEPRPFCVRGRPAESCRAFLVAAGSGHLLLGGSRYSRSGNDGVTRSTHMAGHVSWELGAMVNRGPADAVGATVLAGADANGLRLGLKGRYRRWMAHGAALDLGAGVLGAHRAEPFPDASLRGNRHVFAAGLTGDAALGLTEWVGVSVRGDLLYDPHGPPVTAVYGGLTLGTRPTVAATVAPILLGIAAVLLNGGVGD